MFILTLHDRNGTLLNFGDIVKVSDGKRFWFFCEVKYLEKEQVITPFHTFSFSSFEKVDSVPESAKPSTEERYKMWYVYREEAEEDKIEDTTSDYLMGWRQCEHLLAKRCFRVNVMPEEKVETVVSRFSQPSLFQENNK